MSIGRRATIVVACVIAAACSASASDATEQTAITSEGPTTTSTTEPLTIEEQVEQAYLYSWDVYAEAVADLDDSAVADAYTGRALELVIDEVRQRERDGEPARVSVEHNYAITIIDEFTAVVVDEYVNHQVLVDPDSGEPVEADPNEIVLDAYTLMLVDGQWRVELIVRQ